MCRALQRLHRGDSEKHSKSAAATWGCYRGGAESAGLRRGEDGGTVRKAEVSAASGVLLKGQRCLQTKEACMKEQPVFTAGVVTAEATSASSTKKKVFLRSSFCCFCRTNSLEKRGEDMVLTYRGDAVNSQDSKDRVGA